MKRISILMFLSLLTLGVVSLTAAPPVLNVGDAHELDTDYPSPYNVNFGEWFAAHQLPAGEKGPRMDVVFRTPRVVVLAMTIRGNFPLHYHTASDEILVPIKGKCKEYVDGKWSMVQAGDVHYNPRGVVHGLPDRGLQSGGARRVERGGHQPDQNRVAAGGGQAVGVYFLRRLPDWLERRGSTRAGSARRALRHGEGAGPLSGSRGLRSTAG